MAFVLGLLLGAVVSPPLYLLGKWGYGKLKEKFSKE